MIRFRVVNLTRDRRSPWQLAAYAAIEQTRADKALERIWQERVEANIGRRLSRVIDCIDAPAVARRSF